MDILTYDPILQRTYLKIDCLLFWPFRGIVDLFFWLYIATFCLPWVPGAPPGGSLGGVPGPMSSAQNWAALLVLASFFMTILTSIFDRLGVDLGSVLGVIFGRFGALVGQSWSQDRLRTVLTSKK